MIIQFHTDRLINWDEQRELHFKTAIEDRLWPNCSHIAKIEVHLSDESLEKEAFRNIRCLIEVYLKGHQRISATIRSDSEELAITGAVNKLSSSVKSTIDRISDHRLYRNRK